MQAEDESGDTISKPPTMQTLSEEDVVVGEGPTLDQPLSSLEKLHIIVGYGIVRRDLRYMVTGTCCLCHCCNMVLTKIIIVDYLSCAAINPRSKSLVLCMMRF